MTYKIKYLPEAKQDLELIDMYLSCFYAKTAEKFFCELDKKLGLLSDMLFGMAR